MRSSESRTRFYVHKNIEVHLSFLNEVYLVDTVSKATDYPYPAGGMIVYPAFKYVPARIEEVLQEHFKRKRTLRARAIGHCEGGRSRIADPAMNPFLDPDLYHVVHYVKNWETFGPRFCTAL